MPSYAYTVNVKIDNGYKDLVKILMIDTIMLCGNSPPDTIHNVYFYSLADRVDASGARKTRVEKYFETISEKIREIGESDVPYFIVTGHFPVKKNNLRHYITE